MKVYGLDINVRVKGVLVEENRATCVMGHVEALQGNDMPLSCSFLFEGIFFPPTGSSIPVVDAESPVHNRTGRKAFSGTFQVRRGSVSSIICLPGFRVRLVWPMK